MECMVWHALMAVGSEHGCKRLEGIDTRYVVSERYVDILLHERSAVLIRLSFGNRSQGLTRLDHHRFYSDHLITHQPAPIPNYVALILQEL